MMADFRSSFKMTFSNLSLRLDTFTPRAAAPEFVPKSKD